ncbi:MAG: hypothetical protein OP8BY_1654 [Candidatus Saccharicenans subterraneus]|uniref:DUF3943 domain-containing protein n=1 Tax=Candidatus Saccharicenans subterraneus TaxID=2508984 RepID=A0A3E2BPB1_9BACT|nr:MAG: hypothetical protein OP8BY_1654 [Candidatus Saccharicenans subterraneum]
MRRTACLLAILLCLSTQAVQADHKKSTKKTVEEFVAGFSLSAATRCSLVLNDSKQEWPAVIFSLSENNGHPDGAVLLPVSEFERTRNLRPRWGRAGLELAMLMSYSQARYWIRYSRFIEDWQYRLTWADQKRRFFTTEALRFDSNAFYLNWTHALAGMLYYEFARTNNLSWLQSLVFSFGGSLYWEYIVEWREIISINDNIMTAVGGFALGEAWFQMGRYFHNSNNPVGRLLSWLNPFMKANGWLDRKKPLSAYHHNYNRAAQDVYLFLGYRNSPVSASPDENTGNLAVSLHSRIITDSSYGLPGRVDEKFSSPFYSQMDFDFMFHGATREELGVTARVVPLGRFKQDISWDRKGFSLYYGLGSAFFLYLKRPVTDYDAGKIPVDRPEDFHFELPRDFRDKLAAVHFLGPVADLTLYSGPWKLRLKTEAYPSFGMINSLPLNSYSADNDIQGMKTTLKFYGYHYAFGPDLESLAEITYRSLRLTGFYNYVYYRSIQGRDRFQSWLTDDSPLRDSRKHYGLRLEFRIPGTLLSLTGSMEGVKRWGRVHELEARSLEKRYYLGLKYRL